MYFSSHLNHLSNGAFISFNVFSFIYFIMCEYHRTFKTYKHFHHVLSCGAFPPSVFVFPINVVRLAMFCVCEETQMDFSFYFVEKLFEKFFCWRSLKALFLNCLARSNTLKVGLETFSLRNLLRRRFETFVEVRRKLSALREKFEENLSVFGRNYKLHHYRTLR